MKNSDNLTPNDGNLSGASQQDLQSANIAENKDNTPIIAVPKHRAPMFGDILAIIGIYLASQIIGAIIPMLFGVVVPDASLMHSDNVDIQVEAMSQQARFLALGTFFSMLFCFGIMAFYNRSRGWVKLVYFRTPSWATPYRLLCGYALMGIFSIAIEPITELLPGSQDMLGGGGWLLISAVLLAPIFEEVVFRGYIAGTIRRIYGVTTAWIVSSLLFGFAHMIPSVVLPATLMGLVLGYYYLRHRSLVLVVLLHAMNNITACFLKTVGMDDVTTQQLINNDRVYWVVYALCVSISIIAIARMWQIMRELSKNKYVS